MLKDWYRAVFPISESCWQMSDVTSAQSLLFCCVLFHSFLRPSYCTLCGVRLVDHGHTNACFTHVLTIKPCRMHFARLLCC